VDHEVDHQAVHIRPAPVKRFVSIHDGVANLHTFPRHAMSSSGDRAPRSGAMVAWREIAEPGVAAQRQGKAPRLRPAAGWQVDSTLRSPRLIAAF